ncbi:NAD(P)H-binding protein [Kutzneria kofuensis]|uniref:NAD(P)H-binding protein n=1 Tax=Kutzneria kofuensis TaxID=103725 RepID=UPI0031EA0C52
MVDQALAAGHEVTAVVRDPGKVPSTVRAIRADLPKWTQTALEEAVSGADAVLSGLGARATRGRRGSRPKGRRRSWRR